MSFTRSITYLANDSRIACLTSSSLDILDVISGAVIYSINLNEENDCAVSVEFAFVKGGTRIATIGTPSLAIRIWEAETGEMLAELKGHTDKVLSLTGSDGGKWLASCSTDLTVRVWDMDQGTTEVVLVGHKDVPTSVAFSSDGMCLVSAAHDGEVRVWHVATGRGVHVIPCPELQPAVRASFSPTDLHVACSFSTGVVKVWDAQTGAEAGAIGRASYPSSNGLRLGGPVPHFLFALDGSKIFTTHGTVVHSWSLTSWGHIAQWKGHSDSITSITMSLDGSCLASTARDGTIGLWDPNGGHHVATLQGHRGVVQSAAFAHDGSALTSSSSDSTLRVWRTTGAPTSSLMGGTLSGLPLSIHPTIEEPAMKSKTPLSTKVSTVVYSRDSLRVAVGTRDHRLRVWDILQDKDVLLEVHFSSSFDSSLAFSPDGIHIAMAQVDPATKNGGLGLIVCNTEDGSLVTNIHVEGNEPRPFRWCAGVIAWSSCGDLLAHATQTQLQIISSSKGSQVITRELEVASVRRSQEPDHVAFLKGEAASWIVVTYREYFSSCIIIYNGSDLAQIHTIHQAEMSPVTQAIGPGQETYQGCPDHTQLSPDGGFLARFVGRLGDIDVYDVRNSIMQPFRITQAKRTSSFVLSKSGQFLVTFGVETGILAWQRGLEERIFLDKVPDDISNFVFYVLRGRDVLRFSQSSETATRRAHRVCIFPSSVSLCGPRPLALFKGLPTSERPHRVAVMTDDDQLISVEFTM